MRTYANFLLFEDVLTNLPVGSTLIQNAANTLMNPTVEIVETDCGTLLGAINEVNYALVGKLELSNNTPITVNRVTTLLSQGVSSIRIRNTATCVSKNGICVTCYSNAVPPTVGQKVSIPSEFAYKTDVITGDGINSVYPVSQNSSQYTSTSYSPILHPEVLSLTDTHISFDTVRLPSQVFVLSYYNTSSNPFLEYLAKSYSGGLFGISPLPAYQLRLKPSLYQSLFSESQMQLLRNELNNYSANIPSPYLAYCDTITDSLEKILYIIYLYAIYANIE